MGHTCVLHALDGKTKQDEQTLAIRVQRLPCWKQCWLQAGPGFSWVKYVYVKLLCKSKRENERELCGQVE